MSDEGRRTRDVFCVSPNERGETRSLQGANLELGRGEGTLRGSSERRRKSTLLRVVAGIQPPSAGDRPGG
jgi:ABC-type transport system involved in cytochrome c biogenesis ATPase subunit